ncbi:MAG: tetratricopeptide repeat protein [Lachnospiraceae bacterium]|nr:tetratricopeptide repeat protein [Lachnospiraceae bacterium]MBP3609979.1 tetratricopeptide repeat protein [Lachnospiraceae bacterium]
MNCPRCGQAITRWRKRCEFCGQDISVYERLQRLSNSFYNKGLERAKVRDLSGAIVMLKKSLEINKENTEARNLLGLVYFEMGEVVAAISEWVISQNFQPEDNKAAYFLKKVQSDTVAFDSMNQTIKKYNIALANARRQDDDLAVLQLKRVISVNPKFIQALLLLALVYLRNCEYEKAKRCLVRVQKIDVGNVMALRYLEEIRLNTQQGGQGNSDSGKESPESSGLSQMVPVNSYQEDKPNFMAFLTFFLGILIGVAVIYYMAVPNIRKSIMAEYNQKERDYSAVISSKDVTISSLESNIRILESKIDDLERTLRQEEGYTLTDYGPLIEQLYLYQMYEKVEEPSMEQTEAMIEGLEAVDMSKITDVAAVSLYESMEQELKTKAGAYYLAQGMELYAQDNKEAALPVLEQAYLYIPGEPEVLYHLARIYHGLGDLEQAMALYETLIAEHKESTRSQEAQTYLDYIKAAQ